MAALIAPRLAQQREPRRRRLPVPLGTAVWQGAMVALMGVAGVPAAANPALRVLGVAEGSADNRIAGAPHQVGVVDVVNGCWAMDNDPLDPITEADLGNPCFAADDHTVSRSNGAPAAGGAATKPQAGTIFDVDDAGVWVKF